MARMDQLACRQTQSALQKEALMRLGPGVREERQEESGLSGPGGLRAVRAPGRPLPAARAAAGWGALPASPASSPGSRSGEKGESGIHCAVISHFLLLSRSSSEREACPQRGPGLAAGKAVPKGVHWPHGWRWTPVLWEPLGTVGIGGRFESQLIVGCSVPGLWSKSPPHSLSDECVFFLFRGPRGLAAQRPKERALQEGSFSCLVGPAGLESQPDQIRAMCRQGEGRRGAHTPALHTHVRSRTHASTTLGPHAPPTPPRSRAHPPPPQAALPPADEHSF